MKSDWTTAPYMSNVEGPHAHHAAHHNALHKKSLQGRRRTRVNTARRIPLGTRSWLALRTVAFGRRPTRWGGRLGRERTCMRSSLGLLPTLSLCKAVAMAANHIRQIRANLCAVCALSRPGEGDQQLFCVLVVSSAGRCGGPESCIRL